MTPPRFYAAAFFLCLRSKMVETQFFPVQSILNLRLMNRQKPHKVSVLQVKCMKRIGSKME